MFEPYVDISTKINTTVMLMTISNIFKIIFIYLFICLFIYLDIYFVYLFIHLLVYLFINLSSMLLLVRFCLRNTQRLSHPRLLSIF